MRAKPKKHLASIGLATADENGVRFETGVPTSFPFVHNTERSPKPLPGDGFQQKLEPAGYYCLTRDPSYRPVTGWVSGQAWVTPLVLWDTTDPAELYGPGSWKARLSQHFGNQKRRALSGLLERAGFDAVVTVRSDGTTGEIVLLDKARVAMD